MNNFQKLISISAASLIYLQNPKVEAHNHFEPQSNLPKIEASLNQTKNQYTQVTNQETNPEAKFIEDVKDVSQKTGRYIQDKYRKLRERIRSNNQQTPENLCKRQRARTITIEDRFGRIQKVICAKNDQNQK